MAKEWNAAQLNVIIDKFKESGTKDDVTRFIFALNYSFKNSDAAELIGELVTNAPDDITVIRAIVREVYGIARAEDEELRRGAEQHAPYSQIKTVKLDEYDGGGRVTKALKEIHDLSERSVFKDPFIYASDLIRYGIAIGHEKGLKDAKRAAVASLY